MTHLAWVPPEWVDAAERDARRAWRSSHPSRTIAALPAARRAETGSTPTSRCAASRSATAPSASEVIELRLRGERVAGAGVDRAAAAHLRPAGLPALARRAAVRRVARSSSSSARRPADRRLDRVGRAALRRARGASSSARRSRTSRGRGRTLARRSSHALAGHRGAGDPRARPAGRGGAAARLAALAAATARSARRASAAELGVRLGGEESRPARRAAVAERPPERRARPLRPRPRLRGRGRRRPPLRAADARGPAVADPRCPRRVREVSETASTNCAQLCANSVHNSGASRQASASWSDGVSVRIELRRRAYHVNAKAVCRLQALPRRGGRATFLLLLADELERSGLDMPLGTRSWGRTTTCWCGIDEVAL